MKTRRISKTKAQPVELKKSHKKAKITKILDNKTVGSSCVTQDSKQRECFTCNEFKDLTSLKKFQRRVGTSFFMCFDCIQGPPEKEETPPQETTLTCDLCEFSTTKKSRIRSHIESHLNLSCDVCKNSFKSKHRLMLHLSTYFQKLICHQCGSNFNKVESLKRHLLKHDPQYVAEQKLQNEILGSFPCNLCPLVFDKKNNLVAHVYRSHKDGKSDDRFVCKACSKGFYTREDLRLHEFEHFSGKIHHCDFPGCEKFFKRGKLLTLHKKTHYPPGYECLRCGTKFVQKSGLLKHKRRACKYEKKTEVTITDEAKDRIIQTALAQYETLRVFKKNNLKFEVIEEIKSEDDKNEENFDFIEVDVKEDQEEEENWVYEYLDEAIEENPITQEVVIAKTEPELEFDQEIKDELEITQELEIKEEILEDPVNSPSPPIESTSKPSKKPRKLYNEGIKVKRKRKTTKTSRKPHPNAAYICDLCGNHYSAWSTISNHILYVHKPVGDIFCEFCDKSFKSNGNYKRHVTNIHKNVKNHVCHLCAKSFVSSSHLKDHLVVHEQPEECKICGHLVKNMKKHLKQHKNPTKKAFLPCPICGKIYSAYTLQRHVNLVHEKVPVGGKVWRCEECMTDFTRREDLRQHNYLTHSEGIIFTCSDCDQIFRTTKALHVHRFVHEPENVKCEQCGKSYSRRNGLYKHNRKYHPELVKTKID